jgi:hypothetical protein
LGREATKELIFENFSSGQLHRLVNEKETKGLASIKHSPEPTKQDF